MVRRNKAALDYASTWEALAEIGRVAHRLVEGDQKVQPFTGKFRTGDYCAVSVAGSLPASFHMFAADHDMSQPAAARNSRLRRALRADPQEVSHANRSTRGAFRRA